MATPLYTACTRKSWFKKHQSNREALHRHSEYSYLPFTRPGQRPDYELRDANGGVTQHRLDPETFEDAMDRWLNRLWTPR
ncbi:hypothetical protein VCB98_13445 [Gammaproteobacteria bacterium AB-CW1]|uniref:Uncharacterized protein n=1 Tax=Natronospira elongata TaxID=3110268 RepID=A0AAP6JHF9_9GAMM|nr:hypothetical protein [Gammaproteobacteria bacterium AB-CW1]